MEDHFTIIGFDQRASSPMLSLRYRLRVVGAQPYKMCLPIDFDFDEEVDRRIYCRHYDLCLDYAVDEEWISWSCRYCSIRESITEDEMRDQAFEILKTLRLEK